MPVSFWQLRVIYMWKCNREINKANWGRSNFHPLLWFVTAPSLYSSFVLDPFDGADDRSDCAPIGEQQPDNKSSPSSSIPVLVALRCSSWAISSTDCRSTWSRALSHSSFYYCCNIYIDSCTGTVNQPIPGKVVERTKSLTGLATNSVTWSI